MRSCLVCVCGIRHVAPFARYKADYFVCSRADEFIEPAFEALDRIAFSTTLVFKCPNVCTRS